MGLENAYGNELTTGQRPYQAVWRSFLLSPKPARSRGRVVSARSSLFARVRAAVLALGQSDRSATRKARLLESASFSDFTRLTPEQNVKLGRSPKARHYALKGARITKATPTISARQFETKRTSELFGLSPETATQARQRGAISYASADQRERVAKAAITREENNIIAAIKKLRSSGDTVPSNSPDKRRHGSFYPVSEYAERRYRALRRRKLAGEHIPDGDWQWLVDYARRFKDPKYELMRGSPAAFGFTLTV
jgi:hypothetical protein